jgi:hypothetical protein
LSPRPSRKNWIGAEEPALKKIMDRAGQGGSPPLPSILLFLT